MMTKDKRQAIVQSALFEFARKGYEAASTNSITKRANVSKGILFHYFADKRSLFLTVVEVCINDYFEILQHAEHELSNDLFEALGQMSKLKMEWFRREPMKYELISKAFLNMPEELKDELTALQRRLHDRSVAMLADRLDTGRFRKGVRVRQAVEFVLLSLEAVMLNQIHAKGVVDLDLEHSESSLPDLEPYLDMMKYGIYAGEERL